MMKKTAIALTALITLNAYATTQNLSVSGTVGSQCSFVSVNNGTFGFDVTAPNILDTASTNGSHASVGIAYNNTPTISINEITSFASAPSGFNDTVNFTNRFFSANAGQISYSGGVASFTQSSGTTDTLTLQLRAVNATANYPVGNYTATTTITCI